MRHYKIGNGIGLPERLMLLQHAPRPNNLKFATTDKSVFRELFLGVLEEELGNRHTLLGTVSL